MTERKKKKTKPSLYLGRFLRKARVKKSVARRGYGMANETISGCRNVTLHCVLMFAKKRMKRSSALSTLQNGIFGKGALRFSFFYLHIITKTYYFDRRMEILRTKHVKCSERVSLYASV